MDARLVCSAVWTESTRADSSSISSAAVEELADGHVGLNGQTLINATITGAIEMISPSPSALCSVAPLRNIIRVSISQDKY